MGWANTFEFPWMVVARASPFTTWAICGFYRTLEEAMKAYTSMGGRTDSSRLVRLHAR